jgi:hypothetical protein
MITEEARHELYTRLEQVLGAKEAALLMEHLPPGGWADVATKRDLDQMAALLRADIVVLGSELRGEMKAGHADLLRTLFFAMVASNATLVGLVLAAVKLA